MPQFVVLHHEFPLGHVRQSHWDFMLEDGPTLRTWTLAVPPEAPPEGHGSPIAADALADHRREYLTYEGPVSGDRGTVSRWDTGSYRLIAQSDLEWSVELSGRRVTGVWQLRRSDVADQRWELSWIGPVAAVEGGAERSSRG